MIPEYVKKSFDTKERMWIKVIAQVCGGYVGTLANKPVVLHNLKKGQLLFVKHEEILDYRGSFQTWHGQ